ncbi:MAG: rhodanese-like domain-containing protein [Thermodesulfobacteriota bacterium]|nr:rhodanese-like domain-containing protein [Thermodesulfobacteriota bacterium]
MKRFALFALVLVLGIGFTVSGYSKTAKDMVRDAEKSIKKISVSKAKAMHDKGETLFLDLRTEKEYNAGHIPGAVFVPRGQLEFKCEHVLHDKDATYVIYAGSRGRASLGVTTLYRMGYKNAVKMNGGFAAWKRAGYPVEY